jgi:hypothetical protein
MTESFAMTTLDPIETLLNTEKLMHKIHSVYIVEPIDQGWIIERLMRDIAAELSNRGILTRIGASDKYSGEDVIFNSRFLVPLSDARAKVNSLFITHVDDKIKEMQLKVSLKGFNSFVCMSPQDADFLAALNGSRSGVTGIELATRDLKVRPMRLAMFSACYEDGRKNEQWITDYFQDKPAAYKQNFVFCFMGWGWEKFCATLGELEMNYEVYRYSRFMPGEYDHYKEVLATMDTLIYLGFDGGAMSVYDGISAGIEVIASNISYHRDLGDSVMLFDDRSGFFRELCRLHARATARKEALQRRSIVAYTDHLVAHWESLLRGHPLTGDLVAPNPLGPIEKQTLELFRGHYKKLSLTRIRSAIIRIWQSIFLK